MRAIATAVLIAILLLLIAARPPNAGCGKPNKPPCPTPTPTLAPTPAPPTPVPTPVPTPPPPGESVWTQVFEDQFSVDIPLGSFPDQSTKTGGPGSWSSYPYGWDDTSNHGNYDSDHVVSVSGGMLHKRLHFEDGEFKVAAITPILASGDWNQLYGRYEIMFRVPEPLPGYKIAWLLWPRSEVWPRDGEIDFPESNLRSTSTIQGFMHRQGGTSGGDQDAYNSGVLTVGPWHKAVIEWKPGDVRFALNGVTIGHSTSRVPNTPMRWVIQSETEITSALPPTSTDGEILIDYVKVWSYTP